MNTHVADRRKIDPSKKPDGSPRDNDRMEIGPTDLAFAEWATDGLVAPDLDAMRRYRWKRLTQHIVDRDYAGLLMFDPLNIRYATDSTSMQLWNTHNPFRACLVMADGHMVLWDYKNSPFLADHNPLVREVRSGASMFYFATGDQGDAAADSFVAQVQELMRAHVGTNKRIAIDKIMIAGYRAFERAGFEVMEGEEVTEKARAIKGPDDILAMRCAIHSCEAAMAEMEAATQPGMTEDDVWAELHASNIRRGGEWIETRLLASGPRTNPWFQECGPRIIQNNEIIAYDTDLVGVYGICADLSRTYWVGDGRPRQDMIDDFKLGMEHIAYNMERLKPGVSFLELSEGTHVLPEIYQKQKYSCLFHGVGMCDEWPLIAYPDKRVPGAFDKYVLEPGMTLCVEALISREGGDFSIKLEDQVVITEDGCENMTRAPFDAALQGLG
ncbi:MAG: dimethylsulfonioproprionate lyase DddP [Pseudomonadota bacterium]